MECVHLGRQITQELRHAKEPRKGEKGKPERAFQKRVSQLAFEQRCLLDGAGMEVEQADSARAAQCGQVENVSGMRSWPRAQLTGPIADSAGAWPTS